MGKDQLSSKFQPCANGIHNASKDLLNSPGPNKLSKYNVIFVFFLYMIYRHEITHYCTEFGEDALLIQCGDTPRWVQGTQIQLTHPAEARRSKFGCGPNSRGT